MSSRVTVLSDKIALLEAELEAEFAIRCAELHIGLEKGKAVFEEEILPRQAAPIIIEFDALDDPRPILGGKLHERILGSHLADNNECLVFELDDRRQGQFRQAGPISGDGAGPELELLGAA